MNLRCAALAFALTALLRQPAAALEPACPALAVEADSRVLARWPNLVEELRRAFAAREDIDQCARARVFVRDAGVVIEVLLRDGRSAARDVSERADVTPTLAALLLVPVASAVVTERAPQPSAAASQPDSSRVGIEFGVQTGARIGDGLVGANLGLFSWLELSGLLIGLQGQLDGYAAISGTDQGAPAFGVGALAGWRFRFGTLALDLVAGPMLALLAASSRSVSVMAGTAAFMPEPEAGDDWLPRLHAGARLNFSARSILHTFVGIDAVFGPAGAARTEPRLPTWALGLVLGATLGTR